MARQAVVPKVKARLAPIEEGETIELAARRAEEFLLYSTGWRQSEIAKRYGITQATVSHDIQIETQNRRDRAMSVDGEIERIAGIYEGVLTTAWKRHNEAADDNPGSVAGATYLKLVMEVAEKYAQLRGIDGPKASTAVKGTTRVIVQIGGSHDQPAIAVGVESQAS